MFPFFQTEKGSPQPLGEHDKQLEAAPAPVPETPEAVSPPEIAAAAQPIPPEIEKPAEKKVCISLNYRSSVIFVQFKYRLCVLLSTLNLK